MLRLVRKIFANGGTPSLCYYAREVTPRKGQMEFRGSERAYWEGRLEALRTEHRDLDDVIARVTEEVPFDQLRVQRLKKRKLLLKDEIALVESWLLPDSIA